MEHSCTKYTWHKRQTASRHDRISETKAVPGASPRRPPISSSFSTWLLHHKSYSYGAPYSLIRSFQSLSSASGSTQNSYASISWGMRIILKSAYIQSRYTERFDIRRKHFNGELCTQKKLQTFIDTWVCKTLVFELGLFLHAAICRPLRLVNVTSSLHTLHCCTSHCLPHSNGAYY
jgi:hypothetical protein